MGKIRKALISVSDKTGLIPLARALHKQKIEILSTGGTLKVLTRAHIPALSISEVTGFPEILGGRVKTLHPLIYGGLLYRRGRRDDEREIKRLKILPIDMVVVNLYPFDKVTQKKVKLETALENIDIGGPTLLRAAAKNFESVVVVTDPADYEAVIEELGKRKGMVSLKLRRRLAQKVFERTSRYDHLIARYLERQASHQKDSELPRRLEGIYEKSLELRYGENPHQRGALYRPLGKTQAEFRVIHGKELSFNNLLDIEATMGVLCEFNRKAACVVKHTNPCGIAEGRTLTEAVEKAIDSDLLSAFGGIVGLNDSCDGGTAKRIYELLKFVEVVVAPRFDPQALAILKERKNVRLVETGKISEEGPWDFRFTKFGILLQDRDLPIRSQERALRERLKHVTETELEKKDIDELIFAWKCAKTVRSNAIVITKGYQTVGIGAGQMSRVDSVEIACRKAGYRAEGGYLASDAFFPLPDSIELAYKAGIRAVIQPGGSIRDAEVIQACNHFGIAMVFTGERHFKH